MVNRYKFRAWSKKDKRMIYLSHNESSSTHLQMNNHAWGVFEPDNEDYCGAASLNGGYGDTLMQWIGIKDKKKQDIYECDIILLRDDDDELFEVKWDDETARFILVSESLTVDFDNYYGYECEILGNIYENPKIIERR